MRHEGTSVARPLGRALRPLLKEALYALVRASGLAALVRTLAGRRRVGILVYHRPTPEALDRHLAYLRRVANVVPLDALVAALGRGDLGSLPPRSVVITIDDGHRSNRALLDVLARHGVVPTIFVCTQIVGTRRRYWWTAVDLREGRRLMRIPNGRRLEELRARYHYGDHDEAPDAQALSLDEIRDLAPFVDFQPHSRLHPILTSCTRAESEDEIAGSKTDLETILGRPCRHFAYPNGDHGEREIELLRAAGFASARTIEFGWNGPDTDPYRLKVLGIADDASVNALAAHLAGVQILRRLARFRRISGGPKTWRSRDGALDLGHGRPAVEPPTVAP